eukprot:g2327.t1
MEERLRREREETSKLQHTIDAIEADKVDVRRSSRARGAGYVIELKPERKTNQSRRVHKRRQPRGGAASSNSKLVVLAPRYRPQVARNEMRKHQPRNTIYTNFSRAPRFEWQKYDQEENPGVPNITHLGTHRKHVPSPGPGDYNLPTCFSPNKLPFADTNVPLVSRNGSATKNRGSKGNNQKLRKSKKSPGPRNEDNDEKKEINLLRNELATKEKALLEAKNKVSQVKNTLSQLEMLSEEIDNKLGDSVVHPADQRVLREQAATLHEALSGLSQTSFLYEEEKNEFESEKSRNALSSPTKSSSPMAAHLNYYEKLASKQPQDAVTDYVNQTITGTSFRVWEETKEYKNQKGYSKKGKWITVPTEEGLENARKAMLEDDEITNEENDQSRLVKLEQAEDDQTRHKKGFAFLEQIFNTISAMSIDETDLEKQGNYITGKDLSNFLRTMKDTDECKMLFRFLKRARVVHRGGNLFNALDENHDGKIDRHEFIHTLLSTPTKRHLIKIFKMLDVSNDGVIVAKELHDFLHFNSDHDAVQSLKRYIYKARNFYRATNSTHKLFNALDKNHDGAISLHEFLDALYKAEFALHRENKKHNSDEVTTDKKLRHIFLYYCSYGERFKEVMSSVNWRKAMRDIDLKSPQDNARDRLINDDPHEGLTHADIGITFKHALAFQNEHSDMRRSKDIEYDTFLYALREIACKRFREMPPSSAFKQIILRYIIPLYDNEIDTSQSLYTKISKEDDEELQYFHDIFFPQVKSFFKRHHKGMFSIFGRYCDLNPATGQAGGDLKRFASNGWAAVKEVNETLDWYEFSRLLQDFNVTPKIMTRCECEKIFKRICRAEMGEEIRETEFKAVMKYQGFLKCLGMLAMVRFRAPDYKEQCPDPISKVQLFFFKMQRPPWFLNVDEAKMVKAIDREVRETISRVVTENAKRKFEKPILGVNEAKRVLNSIVSATEMTSEGIMNLLDEDKKPEMKEEDTKRLSVRQMYR